MSIFFKISFQVHLPMQPRYECLCKKTRTHHGHACRQFIKSLPLNESTEWTMMNIRGFTKTNSSIYLQDVRGPRVTPSHVMMINTRLLPKWKLDNEQQFCHVITKFKEYDPLYDMEFENMLYYCCFLLHQT